MRKVIVTGGCGYIGSHVARAFKQAGDQVIAIDRVYREHTVKGLDGYYIADFASDDSLSVIIHQRPDVIVHCAGTSLVGPSMDDPGEYYDNNIAKTIRMLNVVRDLEHRPVIMFSSSASVYGEPDCLPIKEYDDIKPISPYGATKAMTERILADYWGAYALKSMCFRYFNAAGAEPLAFDLGQEPGATHLVARTLETSIADRPDGFLTINGQDFDTPDGTCVRDYVHVWDIAQAHVMGADYMLEPNPIPNSGAFVFNLGTNQGTSNQQIVDYVAEKYGIPAVAYGPRRLGDPAELVADAGLIKEAFGWQPKYSDIATIVDSAYRWYTRNV
jgi:UDP-glucose-4-epimerase GalE